MSSVLTKIERRMTTNALAYSAKEAKARQEAERISILAGCWEAMAVGSAMQEATMRRERMRELERQMRESRRGKVQGRRWLKAERQAKG